MLLVLLSDLELDGSYLVLCCTSSYAVSSKGHKWFCIPDKEAFDAVSLYQECLTNLGPPSMPVVPVAQYHICT